MQEELYIAFENYLNNEMSLEEKTTFENQLQNDDKFQEKQFELYKQTTQFLEIKFSNDTVDFKKNLKSISEDHFADKIRKKESKVISCNQNGLQLQPCLLCLLEFGF